MTQNTKKIENIPEPDLWSLYWNMLRNRLFELEVIRLWEQGRIPGEMHLGMGEEAIVAGVVDQLVEGDAMALDHRGTPPLIMRGVDPVLLLREFLGRADGLCCGRGGHMHLFSKKYLAASSGIVGASGPTAAGFAWAAQHLRPGTIAVAFFGDGAANQGMLMESMNLAVAWKLPVLFVCKDNHMAITTPSPSVTGGVLTTRAKGFGMHAAAVDGLDVENVWYAANEAIVRARSGHGPTFLHAACIRLEGHFLGDPILQIARHPVKGMKPMAASLMKSLFKRKGTSIGKRTESIRAITSLITDAVKQRFSKHGDPLESTRKKLESDKTRLKGLEAEVEKEIQQVVEKALAPIPGDH
ncbi:MAG: thiamine pyrophosphate-dependent dehydrogenase E1 component subunit alpha [Candidatus Aminicenantes bacterium]|nr:MAG: thiamine pyrophosphate-dependent dehydrogenase E1 component subunit alpha [Candidatus Aminicenantes bacterium]